MTSLIFDWPPQLSTITLCGRGSFVGSVWGVVYSGDHHQRSLDFNEDKMLKIIRALNMNKAHGHDYFSIRIIKICDESLLKPLLILFKNSNIIPAY